MNLSKEKIEQQLQRFRRKRLIFLIIAIVLFVLSAAGYIALVTMWLYETLDDTMYLILSFASDVCFILGVMFIFLRSFYLGRQMNVLKAILDGKDVYIPQKNGTTVKISTVQVPEPNAIDPKKAQLISQYEDLLKQGLITEEDFQKRKEEILK